ncbi:hypothetical protein NT03LS_0977a, partial [Listeria seeligeri FSL N1-067]
FLSVCLFFLDAYNRLQAIKSRSIPAELPVVVSPVLGRLVLLPDLLVGLFVFPVLFPLLFPLLGGVGGVGVGVGSLAVICTITLTGSAATPSLFIACNVTV